MPAYKHQKDLVSVAFGQQPVPKGNKGLQAYKFLVEYRFFEVLNNAYPLFTQHVDAARFEEVVIAFMRYGARAPFMWKVPNEFRTFIKKQKHFSHLPYVHDLLWFEWTEVALMMKNYHPQKHASFSWKNPYTLSPSAVLKKLSYRVFEEGAYAQKGEYFLLAYYDFDKKRVFYRELAPPLYLFLKALKQGGVHNALETICRLSDETPTAVKAFFEPPLTELLSLHIIQRNPSCP
ncbi:MAG: putative DNA-binding domain-containing protein [Campylobacterales bacterium]|nr:putative DNA-binding domain-containing protein [Campylobacterales bacterium]